MSSLTNLKDIYVELADGAAHASHGFVRVSLQRNEPPLTSEKPVTTPQAFTIESVPFQVFAFFVYWYSDGRVPKPPLQPSSDWYAGRLSGAGGDKPYELYEKISGATVASFSKTDVARRLLVLHAEDGTLRQWRRLYENYAITSEGVKAPDPNQSTPIPLQPKGQAQPMTQASPTFVKTLQTDAVDAAWRTAGEQFVKLAREPLVALLSRHLSMDDPAIRVRIAVFLESDIGDALVTSLLAMGLSSVPTMSGAVPQRLARELRVRTMAQASNFVADVLMGPFRQVMTDYLKDLPSGLEEGPPPALLTESTPVVQEVSRTTIGVTAK